MKLFAMKASWSLVTTYTLKDSEMTGALSELASMQFNFAPQKRSGKEREGCPVQAIVALLTLVLAGKIGLNLFTNCGHGTGSGFAAKLRIVSAWDLDVVDLAAWQRKKREKLKRLNRLKKHRLERLQN